MTFEQVQTPVQEVGYIRFKVVFAATYGTETPSISFGGSSTSLDELATTLVSQPTAQNFASTLLDLAPHPSFAVTSWARLDTVLDSDWCFFRVAITLPTQALSQHVGSQTLAVSGNVTLMFGPSRAAWLAIAARLGPQFGAFLTRVIPAIGPQAAAGGGAFSTWLGPIGMAIPLGIAVRDFAVAICAAARAQGIRRGHWNQVGTAYVWHVYGMGSSHRFSNPAAAEVGVARAQADIQRHGVARLRGYLEQHFREGRAMPSARTQAGDFDDREVLQVGFELGEVMFRATEG